MSPRNEKLLFIILMVICIGVTFFVGVFIYEVADMIKDHKCSTTTDIKWYVDNDCMKYYKNPWDK